jgi:hypothetical protein
VKTELEQRYGDSATIVYHSLDSADARKKHAGLLADFEQRGLIYPVTAVDGIAVYDGAVSYPAIMRAVHNRLLEREEAASV